MEITHACGHTDDQDDSDGTAWKTKNRSCDNCLADQRRRVAAIDAALPALVGTDKQIEWARTLRARYLIGNPTPGLDHQSPVATFADRILGAGTPGATTLAEALDAAGRRQTDAAWLDRAPQRPGRRHGRPVHRQPAHRRRTSHRRGRRRSDREQRPPHQMDQPHRRGLPVKLTRAQLATRYGVTTQAVGKALAGPRNGRPAPDSDGGRPARYDQAAADRWWGYAQPGDDHSDSRYRAGCRCSTCRAAHADVAATYRRQELYGDSGPLGPNVRTRIVAELRAGRAVMAAAATVGVTYQRVYAAMRALPEFGEQVRAAEQGNPDMP
jgi:hypothetical protein